MSSTFFPAKGCDRVKKEGRRRPLLKERSRHPSIQHTHPIISSDWNSYRHHNARTWAFSDCYIYTALNEHLMVAFISHWIDFTLPVASHFHYTIRNLTFHFTKKQNKIPNKLIFVSKLDFNTLWRRRSKSNLSHF